MRIAICDDDEYYRTHFLEITQEYALQNKEKEITVTAFTDAEKLLEAVNKSGGFDIYLLDIIMPGINGIELGEILRQKGFDEKIIYLTTSEEFAVASYRVNAADYIVKPAKDAVFLSSLDAVVKSVSHIKDKFILVRTKDGSVKLSFDSIVYAELIKRTVVYHLKDGRKAESIYIRTNFNDTVKELLNDTRFTLCGKSLLLNMHHITGIESETVTFSSAEKISIGKKLCRDLHNTWVTFTFSEVKSI